MGHAIATAAMRRGARVVLVSGPTALTPPPGVVFVPVQTAEEMREASLQHLDTATIVIKAAAVADYRVKEPSAGKIKSNKDEGLTLSLVPNPDIIKELASRKGNAFLVGFAAETSQVRDYAVKKLHDKGLDLMVANDVSQSGIGFESDDNEVLLLDRWGGAVPLPRMPKSAVAHAILDRVLALRAAAATPARDRSAR
jgi:phosphopantothenoylcysteine decarboxylase/phosphopantothenate--cysteine ligase